MSESLVYMTMENREQAANIGAVLVERRLAACVNVIPGMESLYWWNGQVQHGSEAVLIAKTRSALVAELVEAVKAVHPHEVPCIVSMRIEGGNPDFLTWIREETK
ncbi:divalent-cation tolerance protein CutA [Pseudodesulfovibrio tunisiensis]|uniref:divalent-cation tolerance protein CutA n=1 Tax=Pseudodesulfovibrio tunisiensis TaxID=463192 RepID=UPI001FB27C9C|nr:divalent-cation tolerance protein CutA [Pseudodesulfovibrio tunisiensis]